MGMSFYFETKGNSDIKYKVFETTLKWGSKQGLKPKGVVFVTTRLITYLDNKERAFLKIYNTVEHE